jgi:hypothetical protein
MSMKNVGARRLSGKVFLQLLLMIRSFGRPLSQFLAWDKTLKVDTQVLQPALVALRYCDDMKGGTLSLLYSLLVELDTTYSKPIKGLDETIRTKLHNVFMSRWSDFHDPVHSAAFTMDRQFCRRDMDAGVKKDIWSVMEDFSKSPGGKDLSKMKAQYEMFVDTVGSKQVTV